MVMDGYTALRAVGYEATARSGMVGTSQTGARTFASQSPSSHRSMSNSVSRLPKLITRVEAKRVEQIPSKWADSDQLGPTTLWTYCGHAPPNMPNMPSMDFAGRLM